MERFHDDTNGPVRLEIYQCSVAACGLKVALWWEIDGKALSPDQMTWVERQVAARGAFFPADFTAQRRRP